jgi:hypothetical protein
MAGYVCIERAGASYEAGALTGVSSRGAGATNGAGVGDAAAAADAAAVGRKAVTSGVSRPLALVASSA